MSTITSGVVNSDGVVQIFVDGAMVVEFTNIRLGLNVSGTAHITDGDATWNVLMMGPMGRFDNLCIRARQGPDVVSYYHTDALGSVRMMTDAAGQPNRTRTRTEHPER